MVTDGIARPRWLLACTCALLLSGPGVARAVTDCTGVADGTPCDENGDGCYYNDGKDHCLAGACKSPPPCDRTTFTALHAGAARMDWSKDPSQITPGEYCEGNVFVTVEQVQAIAGITPPAEAGLVPISRARNNRKDVPPTGKVRLKLRLNRLGRLLLTHGGTTLDAVGRMTLTKPNGSVAGANRAIALRR